MKISRTDANCLNGLVVHIYTRLWDQCCQVFVSREKRYLICIRFLHTVCFCEIRKYSQIVRDFFSCYCCCLSEILFANLSEVIKKNRTSAHLAIDYIPGVTLMFYIKRIFIRSSLCHLIPPAEKEHHTHREVLLMNLLRRLSSV